ncbi:hypothetical protein [Bacillus sp. AFS029533]|uniref:hypothetical protein n=1 Tax=Bacillus sp. AFS029533 TaxID=2033494 RepID=UPI000BFD5112|nr:hypothetical protein [Bacillus sp. AFS029533]PGZ90919.1 hypothetical protein COE53_16405 [Bacillus sp. AFS029533]
MNYFRSFKEWLTKDYIKRDMSSLIFISVIILFIFFSIKYQWGKPLSAISNLFGSFYFIADIVCFFLFIILIRVIEDGIRKIVGNGKDIGLVSSLLYIGVLISVIIIVNQYYL